MNDYEIYTDASADIEKTLLQSGEIRIIPMKYDLGDEEKTCYGTESDEEKTAFYQAERNGVAVKSTQINPASYREIFEPIVKEGKDVLYLCLSGGLSQTYASSMLAAKELMEEYPNRTVTCVDSVAATVGLGLLAEYAAENKKNGLTLKENAADLEARKSGICHWFTVDDLGFLKRGGRIPPTLATLGKMLHIKPIMRIDEKGKLGSFNKKIGLKFALNELVRLYDSHSDKADGEKIKIVHCDCPEFAETVKNAVLKINPSAQISVHLMSPVIGVHVGYDVVGIVHYGNRAV